MGEGANLKTRELSNGSITAILEFEGTTGIARKAKYSEVVNARDIEIAVIIDEASLAAALSELCKLDPTSIGEIFLANGPPPLRLRPIGFESLVQIIIAQQVSTTSADAIFRRLISALGPLDAQKIYAADESLFRLCGLSSPKIRAIRALSAAVTSGDLNLEGLSAQSAQAALTTVKGIGPWTADIYRLACLGDPNAFPISDLALQEAARMALKLKSRPDARSLEDIAERWRPYRGVAARLLWAYYRNAKKHAAPNLAQARGKASTGATRRKKNVSRN